MWTCCCSPVSGTALRRYAAAPGQERAPHELLSDREWPVVLRLAQAETVGHLAHALCLSVKAVSAYLSRVRDKLELARNIDLPSCALARG
jgi:two-component system, NarL family, invasion response regulator UvrY